jgi:hypothetical protein
MAPKNPIPKPVSKLVGTALGAITHPKDAAEKVVQQAKGTAALGKMVVEGVAEQVVARRRGRQATDAPHAEPPPAHLHSVSESDGDGETPAKRAPTKKAAPLAPEPKEPPVVATTAEPQIPEPLDPADVTPGEPEFDPIVEPTKDDLEAAKQASPADVAKKVAGSPVKKAAAKKAPAKKAPAKKAAVKNSAAKKSAGGDKLPPRKQAGGAAGAPAREPNPEATA